MGRIVTLGTIVALVLVTLQSSASADVKRIDRATARGTFAIAIASGSVKDPTAVWVKIKARPNQRVDGNWDILCTKGYEAKSRSGNYSARTPFIRKLTMPYRHPDSCNATAFGSLSKSGKIIVTLFARV